ncbi:cation:proton antiporter [Streptomyces sp. SCSIO ZS0520]|uniref:cation:proton antiporter n=1 Tax=Streptomyces sp. SCSIO ZS0520 TaxID=2892996 RepID=UPI0021D8BB5A|nr:cation:proton antiporter [Streptomyces sp. SCSIO ZS0520]
MELSGTGLVYAVLGLGALGAAVLPRIVARRPLSAPMIFLALGFAVFLLPFDLLPDLDPVGSGTTVQHLTEICVVVALMGAGLAINRPFGRRSWSTTWWLLGLAMPLTILATALAGWTLLGWAPAVALLVAAVLAPTDPVLAGEVRVGEPTDAQYDEDEVRFALTSEAGLNDGLAFPFVMAALALSAASLTGWSGSWLWHWALVEVLLRLTVGVAVGIVLGRLLGRLFFRARNESLRLSEHSEGFVALATAAVSYGLTELLHGYGFLAVFATAVTIRAAERPHGYHRVMHSFMDQIERLLTGALLFLVGGFVAQGGLSALTWRGALLAMLLLLVIRPLIGYLAQPPGTRAPSARLVTAVFGIRGIGSFFYLAYALGHGEFAVEAGQLWAVVTFTVVVSVFLHGVAAAPVVAWLDRWDRRRHLETEQP